MSRSVYLFVTRPGRTLISMYVFVSFLKTYWVEVVPSSTGAPYYPEFIHILHQSTVQHVSKSMKTCLVLGLQFLQEIFCSKFQKQ